MPIIRMNTRTMHSIDREELVALLQHRVVREHGQVRDRHAGLRQGRRQAHRPDQRAQGSHQRLRGLRRGTFDRAADDQRRQLDSCTMHTSP